MIWVNRFLVLFAAFALIAGVSIWFQQEIGLQTRLIDNGLIIVLIAWFWFFGRWDLLDSDLRASMYLVGNLAIVIPLIRIWDGNGLFLFAAYWFGFAYLRVVPALVYAAVLTVSSQWAFGTVAFTEFAVNRSTLGGLGVLIILLMFSGFMASYIEAAHEESDRNRALLSELRSAQEALARQEREAGKVAERGRLAGEIHDTIAQQFISVITNLRAAGANLSTGDVHLQNALEAATQGLQDSRNLLATMQPDILRGRTLTQVLQEIAAKANRPAGPNVTFTEDGAAAQLDRSIEILLVRALQESLRNIHKHAEAENVAVRLSWLGDEVLLDIQDDGIGFDPKLVATGSAGHHMGIATARHRVENAGGTFMLESAPGEGTSLAVSFPIGESE